MYVVNMNWNNINTNKENENKGFRDRGREVRVGRGIKIIKMCNVHTPEGKCHVQQTYANKIKLKPTKICGWELYEI